MIVDNESISSKPGEIIKRLLKIRYRKSSFPIRKVNNPNYNPLKGA